MSTLKPPSARTGRLIAVVGPSGAGKDSVMDGICAARSEVHKVRRVITRAPDAGGEEFDADSDTTFAEMAATGAFALHWTAHGLSYGIPMAVHNVLAQGKDVLANLSRGVVADAADVFGDVVVLHVTAPAEVLSHRVVIRGREQGQAAQKRLSRPAPVIPNNLPGITIDNSGTLSDAVAAALAGLYPERA